MPTPNIVSPTNIALKSFAASVSSAFTSILSCGSNKVLKVSSLVASNVTATASSISIAVNDGTVARSVVTDVSVPENASVVIVSRDNPLYVVEGHSVEVASGVPSEVEITGSYEEIE
jgi:3-polyprenyl-4-hydroxybenzoate decarboxylase